MKRPSQLRRVVRVTGGALCLLLAPLALLGCPSGPPGEAPREVVVYCALDRLFAQPILEDFERETGIRVLPKWDSEATKTTGLVQALRAERERPRCDVFWNNEVVQTIGLARDGLLAPYDSPSAQDLPAHARDPERRWTGFAARARVLIVNTDLVPAAESPTSYRDLLDPKWKGRVGIAKPLFGTTATHAAALFATLGPEGARAFFEGLKANDVVVCAGNAHLKDRVAKGELAFGLTDTDDANLALQAGSPVRVVFPDQAPPAEAGPGEQPFGTLLIPNSVAILAGAPHPDEARALIDYLLRPEVEAKLARARSVQIPLRPGIERADWIPGELHVLRASWAEVADAFASARDYVHDVFLQEDGGAR